jgi:hypothetical protein
MRNQTVEIYKLCSKLIAVAFLTSAALMAQTPDNGYRTVRISADVSSKLPSGSEFDAVNVDNPKEIYHGHITAKKGRHWNLSGSMRLSFDDPAATIVGIEGARTVDSEFTVKPHSILRKVIVATAVFAAVKEWDDYIVDTVIVGEDGYKSPAWYLSDVAVGTFVLWLPKGKEATLKAGTKIRIKLQRTDAPELPRVTEGGSAQ